MKYWIITIVIILCINIIVGRERGLYATTAQPRPNSLGVYETYQNPYSYLLALPVDGQIFDGKYTNIKFQPYAAAALFTPTILFCGDVTGYFNGKHGPVVIVYRTQSSAMYRGIGCHDLMGVFMVETSE